MENSEWVRVALDRRVLNNTKETAPQERHHTDMPIQRNGEDRQGILYLVSRHDA